MSDENPERVVVPTLRVVGIIPMPTEEDLVRPHIRVRREGNTIIATVPDPEGGTREVDKTCSGTRGSVAVEFGPVHPDAFEYTYVVSNDASAFGPIRWLRFNLDLGDHTKHGPLPQGWRAGFIASWGLFRGGEGIAPGETLGPFTLQSRLGPGLQRLVFGGHSSIPDFVTSAINNVLHEDGGAFGEETIYSVALTIGPKLPAGLAAVQNEIAYAASLPAFAALSSELMHISGPSDQDEMKAGLRNLPAKSPLEKHFLRAMLLNLERA